MLPAMYRELVPWYRLIDPVEDHLAEATCYREALERGARGEASTLLELGCGAGHNASFLRDRFRCTLTDVSDDMLALRRELNPACEHLVADMRTLRLERTFDAVLVHDAVMYMTSEADLAAAARTAFEHTRPGGAAVFAPDGVKDAFRERAELLEASDGARALRGVEWKWDPDPGDDTFVVDDALLLRDGTDVRAAHDRHVEGIFTLDAWLRILGGAGYQVEVIDRPFDDHETDSIFLCRRP